MYRIILERFLSFNLTTPSSQYCFLFAAVFSPGLLLTIRNSTALRERVSKSVNFGSRMGCLFTG